ncbi:hypothetical protein LC609_23270 [Nostoc sp. XA013]|nr:hypothetical protein [Nostoc sp. XA013]
MTQAGIFTFNSSHICFTQSDSTLLNLNTVVNAGFTGQDDANTKNNKVIVALNLLGTGDNDTQAGGAANDTISGNAGIDYITGGDGGDSIFGDSGSDLLYGGRGNDSVFGGIGSAVKRLIHWVATSVAKVLSSR